MMKITSSGDPCTPTLHLEGRLTGPWVADLEQHCRELRPCCEPLELDLSGLVYADEVGALTLGLLEVEGVRLTGARGLVRELLSRNAPSREAQEGEGRSADRRQSDGALIARLQAQESEAFEEVVQTYCGRMLATARHLLDDEARAARVVQAAFHHAFGGLQCLKPTTDLAHFLRLETLRATVEEFRRSPTQLDSSSGDGRSSESARAGDDRPPPGEQERALRAQCLIRHLPDEQRLLLWLCDGEGLQPATAGELLGLAAVAAKAHLHGARLALCAGLGLVAG